MHCNCSSCRPVLNSDAPAPDPTGDRNDRRHDHARSDGICPAKEILLYHRQEARPLLREVSALRPKAEPFTPKRTTRSTKRAVGPSASKSGKVENVLLRALGLVPEDMVVDDEAVKELQDLFDSPLREQQVQVIATLFGKCVTNNVDLAGGSEVAVGVL